MAPELMTAELKIMKITIDSIRGDMNELDSTMKQREYNSIIWIIPSSIRVPAKAHVQWQVYWSVEWLSTL